MSSLSTRVFLKCTSFSYPGSECALFIIWWPMQLFWPKKWPSYDFIDQKTPMPWSLISTRILQILVYQALQLMMLYTIWSAICVKKMGIVRGPNVSFHGILVADELICHCFWTNEITKLAKSRYIGIISWRVMQKGLMYTLPASVVHIFVWGMALLCAHSNVQFLSALCSRKNSCYNIKCLVECCTTIIWL